MNNTRETLTTRSLWASAYLLLQGNKLIKFEMLTPHNGHFLFKKTKLVEQDLTEYYSTNPKVHVRTYLEKYNALRDLVMRTKREANLNQGRNIR